MLLKLFKINIWMLFTFALLASNVATIINAKAYDFMHQLVSKIPYPDLTLNSKHTDFNKLKIKNETILKENQELLRIKQGKADSIAAVKNISKRISQRVVRNIGVNVSSIPVQSVPYLGAALVLSVTAADIYDGCQTIKDTNEMLLMVGDKNDITDENVVCGVKLPSIEELKLEVGKLLSIEEFKHEVGKFSPELYNFLK